jgi:hypothetical protein
VVPPEVLRKTLGLYWRMAMRADGSGYAGLGFGEILLDEEAV